MIKNLEFYFLVILAKDFERKLSIDKGCHIADLYYYNKTGHTRFYYKVKAISKPPVQPRELTALQVDTTDASSMDTNVSHHTDWGTPL